MPGKRPPMPRVPTKRPQKSRPRKRGGFLEDRPALGQAAANARVGITSSLMSTPSLSSFFFEQMNRGFYG